MTTQDVMQLISTLGFPIVIVIAFLGFINNKLWPFVTSFMAGYIEVLDKNTGAMQQMTSALGAVGDQIKSQPNAQLTTAVTTLIERMDAQHSQHSQQISATKSEIILAISNNAGKLDKVYHEVTQ